MGSWQARLFVQKFAARLFDFDIFSRNPTRPPDRGPGPWALGPGPWAWALGPGPWARALGPGPWARALGPGLGPRPWAQALGRHRQLYY